MQGEANLKQSLIKDKRLPNLYILPASLKHATKTRLTRDGVGKVLDELAQEFDYIVCDSPAGIEQGAQLALYFADEAIVVTNPEVSSVRDSDRIIGILQSKSRKAEQGESVKEHLLLTRYNPARVERRNAVGGRCRRNFGHSTLGVIPESEAVLKASNQGVPVVHDSDNDAGQTYDDAVSRYLGENRPHRFWKNKEKPLCSAYLEASYELDGLFTQREKNQCQHRQGAFADTGCS